MEYTDADSDLANDPLHKNINGQIATKPQTTTVYEQTHKNTTYQKSEKTQGTKQFKQANSLWTNHQNPNEENLPDLMQDSEDVGTQTYTNSNLNNNFQSRMNTNGEKGAQAAGIINGQGGIMNGQVGNQQTKNQQQYYVNNNSLQTGVFRQLIPYNGSSLVNAVPTASFSPEDHNQNINHQKYTQEDQIALYQEEVTGRMPAKIRCKNCDEIIQTIVQFEPSQTTSICSAILCFLTCTMCCLPYLLNQCKDAVHYCPICGFVIGVKKF